MPQTNTSISWALRWYSFYFSREFFSEVFITITCIKTTLILTASIMVFKLLLLKNILIGNKSTNPYIQLGSDWEELIVCSGTLRSGFEVKHMLFSSPTQYQSGTCLECLTESGSETVPWQGPRRAEEVFRNYPLALVGILTVISMQVGLGPQK